MANEHNAINLSQGFPGFAIDEQLIDLVKKAMNDGFNQYAPMPGLPALVEQIAFKTQKCYGFLPNAETEITVSTGATQAIFTVITCVVSAGDEVVIFEPAYDCYEPAIELAGGIPVRIALQFPDYSINWNTVKEKISNKTKLIIINSPNNPTGSVLSKQDLDTLYALIQNKNIFVLSDEVYEHIVFDGVQHRSILAHKELAQRSFVVSSFGKTFHATGWKMGYCVAPAPLMKEFRKVHQFLVFSCNTPLQHALAEYLKNENNYRTLPQFYQTKRDQFLQLTKTSRLVPLRCKGSYFQLFDYSNISNKNDFDFAVELTQKNKVASIPVSSFYNDKQDNKVLRFCFAKSDDMLEKAAEILCGL